MTNRMSDQLLSQLSSSVARQTGLHFPQKRWPDLERGIQSAARALGYADAKSFAGGLESASLDPKTIGILAGELTVGETYFFREKRSLEIFSEQILPDLARERRETGRRLRIWSAGCCTGEEPYTLAILLDRILPDLAQWQVTILGTDINPRFLQKASEGIFSDWSFRDAPPWLKTNYFKPVGTNHFEIIPRIREMVTFAYLNLAEDVYPSLTTNTNAMDVIFCRNVLMYFSTDGTKRVAHHFHCSLIDRGWLVVSATETSSELFSRFSHVQFPQATLYRKMEKSPPERIVPPSMETVSWDKKASTALLQPDFSFIPLPVQPPPIELQAEPARPTCYEEALGLFELGHYAEAAEKLRLDSASVQPAKESAALMARIYANLGNLAEALSWVEKAIAADKLNAGLHYLRAIILQERGDAEEVTAALRRALYLDPSFVLAHFALGNVALRSKNFKEADRHFANVLSLLAGYQPHEMLPQSDGLVARRLKEMVTAAMSMEKAA